LKIVEALLVGQTHKQVDDKQPNRKVSGAAEQPCLEPVADEYRCRRDTGDDYDLKSELRLEKLPSFLERGRRYETSLIPVRYSSPQKAKEPPHERQEQDIGSVGRFASELDDERQYDDALQNHHRLSGEEHKKIDA